MDVSSIFIIGQNRVTGFSLMPYRKNQADIVRLFKTVKSHIPRTAARNQQLAQAIFHRAAYLGVTPQNMNCFLDQINGL